MRGKRLTKEAKLKRNETQYNQRMRSLNKKFRVRRNKLNKEWRQQKSTLSNKYFQRGEKIAKSR